MVMYGIYNSDTLKKLINTVHKCIIKQPGMKNYFLVNLIIDIIDIYLKMEMAIMP